MRLSKFVILAGLCVAMVATWASADIIVTLASSRDQMLQGRSGQYGGGNQLTTTAPGLNTSYMSIGQKGQLNSNTLSNSHDAIGRFLLGFNLAGQGMPQSDGTLRLIWIDTTPSGFTIHTYGSSFEMYKVSQANGDWDQAKCKWLWKDVVTDPANPVNWAGGGGIPGAVNPGDLAYPGTDPTGGYGGLGAPGLGGYDATPLVSYTFSLAEDVIARGTAYYFTIPLATMLEWWNADNAVPGYYNTGMLLRIDAASEAENNALTTSWAHQAVWAAGEATYTDTAITQWGNFGRPQLTYPAVPEPATLSLLALGGLTVLLRRRH